MAGKGQPTGDYAVGYCRPPVETRFTPGQSGNPSGRRRKPKSIAATIQEKLARRIKVQEGGRERTMTMQELIVESLVRDAAKGDARARVALFSLQHRYEQSDEPTLDPADLSPSDHAIIEAYMTSVASHPDEPLASLTTREKDDEGFELPKTPVDKGRS